MKVSLNDEVKRYFSKEVVEDLYNDLKGKNYRLNLIDRNKDKDLDFICSLCDISKVSRDGEVFTSLIDNRILVYTDNLEPGVITRCSDMSEHESPVTFLYEKVNPSYEEGSILLLKESVRSDKVRGYFNHEFCNVYIIV